MVYLNADNMICALVDKFINRKHISHDENYRNVVRQGLIFQLNMSLSYYTNDGSYDTSRQVFFLYTGNTSVFVAVAPEDERWYGWKNIPLDAWKNTSNHDSCWRSDGTHSPLIALYFEMAEEIGTRMEKYGLVAPAPAKMSQFNNLQGSELFTEVHVITESDPDTHNPSYFRKIKSITAPTVSGTPVE